jgi:hypothetical protein
MTASLANHPRSFTAMQVSGEFFRRRTRRGQRIDEVSLQRRVRTADSSPAWKRRRVRNDGSARAVGVVAKSMASLGEWLVELAKIRP